ncbi:hypothetical protein BGX29_004003, partial [Mortierella sp. GBA35]
MTMNRAQKSSSKTQKPIDSKKKAGSAAEKVTGKDDLLMREILAMGGSEKDLELFRDIDSGSELEGEGDDSDSDNDDKKSKAKAVPVKKSTKKKKADPAEEEPGLKNEVASFMKSLFGSALMDSSKMNAAAEEEHDSDEAAEGAAHTDDEGSEGSEGDWATEEDDDDEDVVAAERKGDKADDSGDD